MIRCVEAAISLVGYNGSVRPMSLQQSSWSWWNAAHREQSVGKMSREQAELICDWRQSRFRNGLVIIDVGAAPAGYADFEAIWRRNGN
jgi:hypothetical protein